jgi:hypothetical protein
MGKIHVRNTNLSNRLRTIYLLQYFPETSALENGRFHPSSFSTSIKLLRRFGTVSFWWNRRKEDTDEKAICTRMGWRAW